MITSILVSLSALAASCAFVYSLWCAELILIFLIPLFYAVIKSQFSVSYKEGFVWGMVFYLIYFYDLFKVIIYRGSGWGKGIAIVFFVGYACFYTTMWFGLARTFSLLVKKYSTDSLLRLIPWIFMTWFYFYWVDLAFFWIFGNWEGNQLNHPVVPLAIRPQWLYFLPVLGKNGLFLCIIIFCSIFALLITKYHRVAAVGAAVLCILLSMGWMPSRHEEKIPEWITKVGCIVIKSTDLSPWEVAEKIMVSLEEFNSAYPAIQVIIMPESSFKFPLNVLSRYMQLWNIEGISLIIGSHRKEGDSLLNTLYLIRNGTIVDFHDKTHTLFFTERVPRFWDSFSNSQDLFLKEQRHFTQSPKKSNLIKTNFLGSFMPFICSELFFLKNQLCKKGLSLCLVNDSWFFSDYIPRLMVLHAKVLAFTSQSSILYVGYRHCLYINEQGNHYFLPTLHR
jgi:apolipoprotein N-acyltransferase